MWHGCGDPDYRGREEADREKLSPHRRMTLDFHTILLLSCVCMCYGIDVRLVDATGALSNVGLLQVKTDGGFGSVCGANLATADVVCRALGYAGGSVSSSACSSYGGGNLCGASGTIIGGSYSVVYWANVLFFTWATIASAIVVF